MKTTDFTKKDGRGNILMDVSGESMKTVLERISESIAIRARLENKKPGSTQHIPRLNESVTHAEVLAEHDALKAMAGQLGVKLQLGKQQDSKAGASTQAAPSGQSASSMTARVNAAKASKLSAEITKERADEYRKFVEIAMKTPASADARLIPIAYDLEKNFDAQPNQQRIWTKEELDVADKVLAMERARIGLMMEKSALHYKETGILNFLSAQTIDLKRQEELLLQERINAGDALDQGAITRLEYDERDLKIQKELLGIQKQQSDIDEQKRQQQLSSIRSDFRKTDVEKWNEQNALVKTNQEREALGANPSSFIDQFSSAFVVIQNQWGTFATQLAGTFKSVFDGAISSISGGITGLIMGTQTWGQALRQIGSTILTTIVQSIVQMGVQWVMTHVVMRGAMWLTHTLGVALGWSSTTQTIAQEQAKAPSIATNAAGQSIGSYGAAAIIGGAAAVAALGLVMAAAMGAFKAGGYTGNLGVNDVAGVVHGREFVMPADATSKIGVETLEYMRSTGQVPSRGQGGESGRPFNLAVHYWSDKREMTEHIRNDPETRHVIVDITRQAYTEISGRA